jgi:hypothetical protein
MDLLIQKEVKKRGYERKDKTISAENVRRKLFSFFCSGLKCLASENTFTN